MVDLLWPLPAGTVLLAAAGLIVYALRGPALLPSTASGAVLVALGALALGHLARIAASTVAWAAHAVWALDLFHERAATELLDEQAARAFSPTVLDRLKARTVERLGVELPVLTKNDDDPARDAKARRIEEVVALARARVPLAAQEARVDGARALAAALGLSAGSALATAAHDLLFANAVVHAVSGFSLVALGLVLLLATIAALGRARSLARKLATDALLSLN